MNDTITKAKINSYYELTHTALALAQKNIARGKNAQAREILTMVECYLSDSLHFVAQKEYVLAYGALNYAHGWLDAGARLKIFTVKDTTLFAV